MKHFMLVVALLLAAASCFATASYYVDVIGAPNGEADVDVIIYAGNYPPASGDCSFLGTVAPNIGRYATDPVAYTPGQGYTVNVTMEAERHVTGSGWLSGTVSESFNYYSPDPYCVGVIDLSGFGNNDDEEENH